MQGRSRTLGLAIAVAGVGLACALRLAFDPVLGDRVPFIFLFPVVPVTAWYLGRLAATMTVVLGAVAMYVLYPLHHAATPDLARAYWTGLMLFVIVSASMIELAMTALRARSRAQQATERLDLSLAAGSMGVWEWNLASNRVWWSDSLEPLHGLPRGAFGQTFEAFRQLIHSDDRDGVTTALQTAIDRRGEYRVEFRFVRPDGSIRWMAAMGRVYCDDDGKPARVVGTARDVTEYHDAAGALREVEGRFAAVMTHAPMMASVRDRDGRYVMANPLLCELLGLEEHQVVGKTVEDVLPPEAAARARRSDRAVLATGAPHQEEDALELDGEPQTFLTLKFPLCDSEDRPVAVCSIASDITPRKDAEAALRDADRRKDEFLAILAHELRNPLAPVRLALEMLRTNDGDKSAAQRAMDVMNRQLNHLVRLIDDLLDVSRITRGKLELRRARILLADVLRAAIETSKPQIDAAGHRLTIAQPDHPVELHADLTRLAQVVSNLLNNAARYTPRGGAIELRAEHRDDELVIAVTDTGIGLAPANVTRVFEMFAQVAPLTTRAHGGLGIGLALARAFVDMHGGRIEASSAGEGQGSTFTVILPVADSTPETTSSPEPVLPSATGLRVLVADDNRDAIDILAGFLEQVGHTVRTANDGIEAVEAATAFEPDICVLDIGMPGIDGYEVARRLRALGREVVLIALTGWGQAEDHRKSREAGFDYHLIKPVQPSTLVKLLATASRTATVAQSVE